jgi:hypothetical protein
MQRETCLTAASAHLHPPVGGFWIWSDREMTWVSAFGGGPHVSDRGTGRPRFPQCPSPRRAWL